MEMVLVMPGSLLRAGIDFRWMPEAAKRLDREGLCGVKYPSGVPFPEFATALAVKIPRYLCANSSNR